VLIRRLSASADAIHLETARLIEALMAEPRYTTSAKPLNPACSRNRPLAANTDPQIRTLFGHASFSAPSARPATRVSKDELTKRQVAYQKTKRPRSKKANYGNQ
jgi:hypothetical protein